MGSEGSQIEPEVVRSGLLVDVVGIATPRLLHP